MGQRRRFTPEFKLQAVRLLEAGQRPAAEIARWASRAIVCTSGKSRSRSTAAPFRARVAGLHSPTR